MTTPELRTGVPIPEERYRSAIRYKPILGRMQVGDSIVVPATEHYSAICATQRQSALTGERFSVIRLSAQQVGVWRVE